MKKAVFAVSTMAVFMFSADAFAKCQVNLMRGSPRPTAAEIDRAQSLVENSSDQNVTAAFADGSCVIQKLVHPGGRECITGQGTLHVRVRAYRVTYHVFDYKSKRYPGSYCTTP